MTGLDGEPIERMPLNPGGAGSTPGIQAGTQDGQCLDEILGERSFQGDPAAGSGVIESQSQCMQHLTGGRETGGFPQALILTIAVSDVADQRVADVFEVDADLVGAAGMEGGFEERHGSEAFEDAVAGAGGPSGAIGDGHAFAVGGMPGDGGVDLALIGRERTAGEREVDLIDLAGAELGGQGEMRDVIFCGHDTTAGVTVEPMDDARAGDPADAAELATAVMEQRIDECAFGMSGRGVNHHPGRFVEDEQVIVLEENVQRDGLGRGGGRFGFGPVDGNALAGARGMGRLDGVSVDPDMTAGDEPLDRSTGHRCEARAEVGIDAFARVGVFDGQLGFV